MPNVPDAAKLRRGRQFRDKVRAGYERGKDLNSGGVLDALYLLIKALEETL